ncbi:hypothetical protein SODALDRAFT_25471 [Sodiomyces alkalinus F11]|uniref:Uncharacterized protein n=1 Tax=Sodiomyces alkalinus (strain CBS 110278 / VKM F-3762 / F11) TaxID=1314773 RepID=A0A3N2Q7W6_SODAK|nr:hypothetical protein SODALDRAFT_25471 [Sodiomyces alkalinus F11]ROT42863.1 hypothetical protein SODALDRAFT_25471 [Sodiomyces alkalinus F11]
MAQSYLCLSRSFCMSNLPTQPTFLSSLSTIPTIFIFYFPLHFPLSLTASLRVVENYRPHAVVIQSLVKITRLTRTGRQNRSRPSILSAVSIQHHRHYCRPDPPNDKL